MNDLVKDFYEPIADIFGNSQSYKNIDFFPIKLKDTKARRLFYRIFQIPKNHIQDETVKRISYLKFLLYPVQWSLNMWGKEVEEMLVEFLELVTKKKVKFVYKGKIKDLDSLVIKLFIDNVEFTEQEFDVIREIVLLQNGLSTEWIESFDPILEEKLIQEVGSYESLTLEEEIFKFCSLMRCSVNDIENYSLLQFQHHFQEQALLFHYETYAPLEISGQIKSKDGREIVKPYFTHIPEKGRYGSILIPLDDFFAHHQDPDMRNEKGESVMNLGANK